MNFSKKVYSEIENKISKDGYADNINLEGALGHQKETTLVTYIELDDPNQTFLETKCKIRIKSFSTIIG